MEHQSPLPHLQVPTTGPYPEPHRSNPCPVSHFLKIYPNIILPSKPGSSKWSLSFRFPHQNPVYTSTLPHTCYIPRPSHSSRSKGLMRFSSRDVLTFFLLISQTAKATVLPFGYTEIIVCYCGLTRFGFISHTELEKLSGLRIYV